MTKDLETLIKQVIKSQEYHLLVDKHFQYFILKNGQFNLKINTKEEFYFIKALVSNRFHKKCPKNNLNKNKFLKFLDLSFKLEIDKLVNKVKKYRSN